MAKTKVYDLQGQAVGELELNDTIFGIEPNKDVVYRSIILHLEQCRQGTAKNKTRSEVRGGGRKPYRQKGTGRARQGSIRSPQFIGGGVVFAKTPRTYGGKLNKKMRQLAMKSALSQALSSDKLRIVDNFELPAAKTKEMAKVIRAFEGEGSTLLITLNPDQTVIRTSNNLPGVKSSVYNTFNVYDLVKYQRIIITKEAVQKIEEVYA